MSQLDLQGYASGDVAMPALLEAMTNEETREYESSLTELATAPDNRRVVSDLRSILESGEDSKVAYAAFYCLNIILRRSRDVSLLAELMNTSTVIFKNHSTFQHLDILFRIEKGLGRHYEEVVRMAHDDSVKFPDHSGVIHLFADTVATVCDGIDSESHSSFCEKWLDKAIHAADRATALDPRYAKYYCTKGRLLALKERFDEGMDLIRVAIDLEDSALADYPMRIGGYQYFLLRMQAARSERNVRDQMAGQVLALQEQVAHAESRVEDSVRRADDSSIKNLEFLGFFAALISFTIGSIQVAVSQTAAEVATLIIVLFGSLMCAFAGFTFIVQRDLAGAARRAVPIFMLGLIVLAIGLLT